VNSLLYLVVESKLGKGLSACKSFTLWIIPCELWLFYIFKRVFLIVERSWS